MKKRGRPKKSLKKHIEGSDHFKIRPIQLQIHSSKSLSDFEYEFQLENKKEDNKLMRKSVSYDEKLLNGKFLFNICKISKKFSQK